MRSPIFSVLHATFGRPGKAMSAMEKFRVSCSDPSCVEYIFACNDNDATVPELMRLREQLYTNNQNIVHFARLIVITGKFQGSAAAWDGAAKVSAGHVLIQGQDDIEPPPAWDVALTKAIINGIAEPRWETVPFFVAVSDGYRKDALCCTAIMSRPYMQQEGHFLCPEYISVFSDDEVTYRALRNQRDQTAFFVDARQIVFRHRHHYHDKTVPFDDTYSRENSAHAYAVGEKLFRARNPRAATDGLKTW